MLVSCELSKAYASMEASASISEAGEDKSLHSEVSEMVSCFGMQLPWRGDSTCKADKRGNLEMFGEKKSIRPNNEMYITLILRVRRL